VRLRMTQASVVLVAFSSALADADDVSDYYLASNFHREKRGSAKSDLDRVLLWAHRWRDRAIINRSDQEISIPAFGGPERHNV